MFENYSIYAKNVQEAYTAMSKEKKHRKRNILLCAVLTIALSIGFVVFAENAIATYEVKCALAAVNENIQSSPVQIKVTDQNDNSESGMLGGTTGGLTSSDQTKLANQIRSSLTPEAIDGATGTIMENGKYAASLTLSTGIPVDLTVQKNNDGTYQIVSIIANLDAKQAATAKEMVENPQSTKELQTQYAAPLSNFDTARFLELAGEPEADPNNIETFNRHVAVLSKNLVFDVPAGCEKQQNDEPQDNTTEKKYDAMKPFSLSWKDTSGSSITARLDNLGQAFSTISGYDAVNKMMGYWLETSGAVATDSKQQIKEEYQTQVFYDDASGMWGYWGRVAFTDGTRDIVYNRVVFINEAADQMITVSYRHDSSKDSGGDMNLDTFKSLFTHAPGGGAAKECYDIILKRHLVPAGSTQTQEAKEAEIAAANMNANAVAPQ